MLSEIVEVKYGKTKARTHSSTESASDGESDSTSEEEDEGEQATEQVDNDIFATLQAIRSKDPRIYNKHHTFYSQESTNGQSAARKDQPLSLQAYHRQNILGGEALDRDERTSLPPTYADEQAALKQDLVRQMHAAGNDENSAGVVDTESDEDFLLAKSHIKPATERRELPSVAAADRDPEAFLSELMASRAWVPKETTQLHPFESDDEDEENEADEFEEAYNMRFEDPERANEKLLSHSRKAAEDFSVRRGEVKGRKKARELERIRKQAEKEEKREEKSRLRNLRIEQTHTKLQQLKEAAGLKDADIPVERWSKFLEAAFDNGDWNKEFEKHFGNEYYAQQDDLPTSDGQGGQGGPLAKGKKAKKPEWEDEVDITDIVPDFETGEDAKFSLSDDEAVTINGGTFKSEHADLSDPEMFDGIMPTTASKKRKRGEGHAERKREARRQHRKIEEIVDSNLTTEVLPQPSSRKRPGTTFRYRATSPTSFGLSARDILLADDRDLNQHHGLKKLAAFRDSARKNKDKRKLDKKKLQRWRKDTFGDRRGPTSSLQDYIRAKMDPETESATTMKRVLANNQESEGVSRSKRKRSRKGKSMPEAEAQSVG